MYLFNVSWTSAFVWFCSMATVMKYYSSSCGTLCLSVSRESRREGTVQPYAGLRRYQLTGSWYLVTFSFLLGSDNGSCMSIFISIEITIGPRSAGPISFTCFFLREWSTTGLMHKSCMSENWIFEVEVQRESSIVSRLESLNVSNNMLTSLPVSKEHGFKSLIVLPSDDPAAGRAQF